jgi:hypothetical protein
VALIKVSEGEIISTEEIARAALNGTGIDITLRDRSFRRVHDEDSARWGVWLKLMRIAEGRE